MVGAEKQTIKASEIKESSGTGENKIYLNFPSGENYTFRFSKGWNGVIKYAEENPSNSFFNSIDAVSISIGTGLGIGLTSIIANVIEARKKKKKEASKTAAA
mgnify:CR=1 FL=1